MESHPDNPPSDDAREPPALAIPPEQQRWRKPLREDLDPGVYEAFFVLRGLIAGDGRPHKTIAEDMGISPAEFTKRFSLSRASFPPWSSIAPVFPALGIDPAPFSARWGWLWGIPWSTPTLTYAGEPDERLADAGPATTERPADDLERSPSIGAAGSAPAAGPPGDGPDERRGRTQVDRRWAVASGGLALAAVTAAITVVVLVPGQPAPAPPAAPAPADITPVAAASWAGTVRGAGPSGLVLRSAPDPIATGVGWVADGSTLRVECGTGAAAVVDNASPTPHTTTVWLRTDHQQFLPALYLDLAGRPSIVDCQPGLADLPLAPGLVAPSPVALSSAPTTSRHPTSSSKPRPTTTTTTTTTSTTTEADQPDVPAPYTGPVRTSSGDPFPSLGE